MIPKQPKKPKKQPKYKLNKATKKQVTKAWKQKKLLCEEIDLAAATKEQMLYSVKHSELLLQRQQETVEHLRKTITFQQKIIEDQKEFTKKVIDKYEDEAENYQKANSQLTLNVDELKTRLFGKFEKRLKDFALRPDKKKDN